MMRLLSLSLLPGLCVAGSGFALQDGTGTCSGGFTLDSFDLTCDDDGACTLGEELTMQGQITASSVLPETANITLQACVWSYICYPYTLSDVSLCSSMGLTSADGSSECPSAGTYTFSSSASAPGDSSWGLSAFEGYTLTIKAEIKDTAGSAATTTCSAKVTTMSTGSDSDSSSAYQMGMGVAAVGLLAVFVRNRRKVRSESGASSSLLETEHSPEPQQQRPDVLEMPPISGRCIV